jgi:hypothetical protein
LLEQAGFRFAAIAFIAIVRAVVKGVNVRVMRRQVLLQPTMELLDVLFRVQAEGNPALIADDHDFASAAVERRYGRFGAGEKLEIAPFPHEPALGQLAVDDPVAINKDIPHSRKSRICTSVHGG